MDRSQGTGRAPDVQPESLYADWCARQAAGGTEDFSDLCAAHPALARKLQECHARVARVEDLLGAGEPTVPRVGGSGERSAPFDELVARLARHRPSESRYEERAELGRGGMGSVLEVYDVDLRRSLAKKVMLDERARADGTPASDASLLGRFVEEAQITAQLGHPGVVPVHELGLDEQGRVYFTMERVGGRTLKGVFQLARDGAEGWSVARAVGVLVRVCETLAYAHSKGVIHRDLKPSNVMVGDFGEVYVMDWGLAKLVGADERGREAGLTAPVRTDRDAISDRDTFAGLRTATGQAAGTPGYMAPEQARGDVKLLDARTDVWALGALLYELLAAQRPYDELIRARALAPLLAAMQSGAPTPLAELAPDAPPELVSIAEQAMQIHPDARYQSAEALAADLRAWLEGRVVSAHERGAWAELRKWVGRNRGLAASLAAVVLALVGGAVVAAKIEHDRRVDVERERAVANVNAAPTTMAGLLAQMGDLWPATPERAEGMQRWSERARELAARRTDVEAALAALRGEPSRFADAALDPKLRPALEAVLVDLDALPAQQAWMEERHALASTLEERTISGPEARARWDAAIAAIAVAPIYDGLELTPQLGLLPLRQDPDSGLWEFWHVLSGDEPELDPATGRWRIEESTGVVLVLIPAGPAQIGAPQEGDPLFDNNQHYDKYSPAEPTDEIFLHAFFLSKYELTRAQWERVWPEAYANAMDGNDLHPADLVTWNGAFDTLQKLDLELPTEAQWEAAGRARTRTRFYTGMNHESMKGHVCLLPDEDGDETPDLDASGAITRVYGYAWSGYHEPVGSFEPNPFGLHDVHGNVWEWCLDAFNEVAIPREGDGLREPAVDSGSRTFRGGGFNSTAAWARITFRSPWYRTTTDYDVGVRPARSIR